MPSFVLDYRREPLLPGPSLKHFVDEGGVIIPLPSVHDIVHAVLARAWVDLDRVSASLMPIEHVVQEVRKLISAPVFFAADGSDPWKVVIAALLTTERRWSASTSMPGAHVVMVYENRWDGVAVLSGISVSMTSERTPPGSDIAAHGDERGDEEWEGAANDSTLRFPLPSPSEIEASIEAAEELIQSGELSLRIHREWWQYYSGELSLWEFELLNVSHESPPQGFGVLLPGRFGEFADLESRALFDFSGLELDSLKQQYGRIDWDATVRRAYCRRDGALVQAVVEFELHARAVSSRIPPNIFIQGTGLYYRFGKEGYLLQGIAIRPVVEGVAFEPSVCRAIDSLMGKEKSGKKRR